MRIFPALFCIALWITASSFRVDTLSIATDLLPEAESVTVVVPNAISDTVQHPTVYLLNGYGGNHLDYITQISTLGEMADRMSIIMIMPDGRNSWYWDTDSMNMESFIVTELVPYIDNHYPTAPVRSQRAVAGLSMGGHGALRLATMNPDIWGSAGSMSGGVDITKFPHSWGMARLLGAEYADNPELWSSHTVASMVPQMKAANVNYTFDCGAEDFFADVNAALHQALLDANVPHDYTSRPGAHNWTYWSNSLPYILHYFHTHFTTDAYSE